MNSWIGKANHQVSIGFPQQKWAPKPPKNLASTSAKNIFRSKRSFFSKNLDPTPSTNQLRPEDDTIKNLTDAFKAKGMWENTLVVFTTDNGGPIYEPGSSNNYPLRCPEARRAAFKECMSDFFDIPSRSLGI